MFGVGLTEIAVISILSLFLFGPERLPQFARQAARLLRHLREFGDTAREHIREELGPDFADLTLEDLDPRKAVRTLIEDAWNETETPPAQQPPPAPPLGRSSQA